MFTVLKFLKVFTGDVCGSVSVVFVHQPGRGPVESGHGVHGTLIRFTHVILRNDQLDPEVNRERLREPLREIPHTDLCHPQKRPGVDFTNCYVPYVDLLRLVLNFYSSKKHLKSWAWGANCSAQGASEFMKSTPA